VRSILSAFALALSAATAAPAFAAEPAPSKQAAPAEKCEHGVKKSVCTRCNPKLEAVYKAKGDWCPEHARPESQCVKCNPALAKEGVK
jgi:serine protease inhibitor ecotin